MLIDMGRNLTLAEGHGNQGNVTFQLAPPTARAVTHLEQA